jgi:predicted dehydrogenase
LAAHGSHRVDQLRALVGDIVEVSALLETSIPHPQRSRSTLDSEVDDGYFLMMRFASGALGACLDGAAAGVAAREPRLEVHGTEGTLVLDGDRLLAARRGEAPRELPIGPAALPGLDGRADVLHGLWFRRIVDAIRSDAPLQPDFEDGVHEMLVLDACRRSNDERRWVTVSD